MTTPTNPIPEFTEAEVLDCLGSYNADSTTSVGVRAVMRKTARIMLSRGYVLGVPPAKAEPAPAKFRYIPDPSGNNDSDYQCIACDEYVGSSAGCDRHKCKKAPLPPGEEEPVLPPWAVEAGVEIRDHGGYDTYYAKAVNESGTTYWCGPDGWKSWSMTHINYGDEPTTAAAIRRVIELGDQPWMRGYAERQKKREGEKKCPKCGSPSSDEKGCVDCWPATTPFDKWHATFTPSTHDTKAQLAAAFYAGVRESARQQVQPIIDREAANERGESVPDPTADVVTREDDGTRMKRRVSDLEDDIAELQLKCKTGRAYEMLNRRRTTTPTRGGKKKATKPRPTTGKRRSNK